MSGAPWDLMGIVGTGQSLSVGASGKPVLSTAPLAGHFKLSLGGRAPSYEADDELELVPLSEPIRPLVSRYPAPYPRNIWGETPHTAMAVQLGALARAELRRELSTVHSVVGESGMGITIINRDAKPDIDSGHAWAASLFETRAIARLAKRAGKSFGVAAVVLTHGESDAERKGYAAELRQFWEDYNRDLPAITGQSQSIPLLLTQQSSTPSETGAVSASTLAAWRAVGPNAGDIVCVGPRYQYQYDDDRVHLTALSYARLGEKYGQVLFQHVVQGRAFRPLEPTAATHRGRAIELEFHVPVPPLRWDEKLGPLDGTRGFELWRGTERLELAEVALTGADTVALTPRVDATGPLTVRYALSAREARAGGCARWGQLCDSDPFVGAHTKTAQPSYAVSFELEVS